MVQVLHVIALPGHPCVTITYFVPFVSTKQQQQQRLGTVHVMKQKQGSSAVSN